MAAEERNIGLFLLAVQPRILSFICFASGAKLNLRVDSAEKKKAFLHGVCIWTD